MRSTTLIPVSVMIVPLVSTVMKDAEGGTWPLRALDRELGRPCERLYASGTSLCSARIVGNAIRGCGRPYLKSVTRLLRQSAQYWVCAGFEAGKFEELNKDRETPGT